MLTLLLNSEATNTNGAIKPCHSPSQKPARPCSPAVPANWLAPGAHPATTCSDSMTRTITSKAEDFMPLLLTHEYEAAAGKVSKCRKTAGPMFQISRDLNFSSEALDSFQIYDLILRRSHAECIGYSNW